MLTSQPLPFCYDGLGQSHKPHSLTPAMGLPIDITFEKPPEGAALKILVRPGQDWLKGLPPEMPFFTQSDLRLRSIRRSQVSAEAHYQPIVSVVGADGKSFGDAAAYIEFQRGPRRGARLLYVWSRLTMDPQLGPAIIEQILRGIVGRTRPDGS